MPVNPMRLYEELSTSMDERAARLLATTLGDIYYAATGAATRADLAGLTNTMNDLAEAQVKTEAGLATLTLRVQELAKTQQRAEGRLLNLDRTVGGLAMTVGYGLENSAMPYFADFARKQFGITIDLPERRNIIYPDGRYDEINVYAEGVTDSGERHLIVAEAKSQLSKRAVERFADILERLRRHIDLPIHPVLITHSAAPQAEDYLREHLPDTTLVRSYEFELKYLRRNPHGG